MDKPTKGPLDVECQYCWACEGEPCYVQGRPGGRDKNQRSPHAARIWAARRRAASPLPGGKEKT